MNYKSMILDILYSNKYPKGVSVNDLKELFNIDTTSEFTQLMKALNDLEDSYEVVRNTNNHYYLLEQLEYFKGILRKNPKGFGFVDGEDFSAFASRSEIRNYLDGDEVLAQLIHNRDGSSECKIKKLIKHSIDTLVGVVKIKDKKKYFLPDKDLDHTQVIIDNYDDYKLVNDMKVQVKITKFGKKLHGNIVKKIGYKYDPGIDILGSLLEHDVDPEFPQEVLEEADRRDVEVSKEEVKNRLDLRDELIITIDGDDSRDFDDAISVKRYDDGFELGVHIADVSHYVEENTPLDEEAYKRGTSVYVVDRVVPMLPQVLSNGICSLNPHVDRLTLSCIMKIDFMGEIIDYKICESVINSKERMTYNNVNKILNHDDEMCKKYNHLLEMIDTADELSKIIRNRRRRLGCVDFDTKESKIIVDEKGKVKDIKVRERHEAELLIEDFMITANECVATHMKNMQLPCMYRVHETPDPKKMRDFVGLALSMGYKFKGDVNNVYPKQLQKMLKEAQGKDNYDVLSTFMLRSMRKARYDEKCLGHFGLALQNYLHFTSPIRRYPDLVVHRMLRKYYLKANYDVEMMQEDEAFISEASEQASRRERIAVECERDIEDMKKCEYMERFVGKKFEGTICSITKFGFFVQLDNTVEGLVHVSTLKDDHFNFDDHRKILIGENTAKVYRMGMKVQVKLVAASRYKKEIDFEII